MKVAIFGAAGYIGSALYQHLAKVRHGQLIAGVDTLWYGCGLDGYPIHHGDYRDYSTRGWLKKFDAIILLAGHSSVPMCVKHPYGSWENNVTNFVRLLSCVDDQKFIYASSAGVYGGAGMPPWAMEDMRYVQPVNCYDLQKWTIDLLAEQSGKNYYGLRFGTVCGWSPNLRTDTIVNRMTLDGLEKREVVVRNASAYRPILDIQDLCRAVEAILQKDDSTPGIYNLATRSASIWCIANDVALTLGDDVEMITKEPTPTYDMSMNVDKFICEFDFQFRGSVVSMVDSIVDGIETGKGLQSDRSETKLYL